MLTFAVPSLGEKERAHLCLLLMNILQQPAATGLDDGVWGFLFFASLLLTVL